MAALILLAAATGLSMWLAVQSARPGGVPGCDAGDCAEVLSSKWSKALGVPVGVFGAAAYGLLGILGMRPFAREQRTPRIVGGALVLMIVMAALWFASLQIWVLKAFCPWCTLTHTLACLGSILMTLAWRRDELLRSVARRRGRGGGGPVWGPAAAIAGAMFCGLVLAQALSPEPPRARVLTASMEQAPEEGGERDQGPTELPEPGLDQAEPPGAEPWVASAAAPTAEIPAEGSLTAPESGAAPGSEARADAGGRPERQGKLLLHGGRFALDPHALPTIGSPDAEYRIVMISDYTCRHCRAAHQHLHQVREVFDGDRLAVVNLPSHHGGESLRIQQLMLAAWKEDPSVWQEVADELYMERMPVNAGAVENALASRLGAERLRKAVVEHGPWMNEVIGLTRDIYAANRELTKSGSIPQFIMGREIIVGAPADAADFFQLLEQHLGLVRTEFPVLELAGNEVDLGRAFAGTHHSVRVAYRNVGEAPLQISRASLPPGGRLLGGFGTEVPPGGTSVVEFSVFVPREDGPFEQVVTLLSNARTSSVPVRVRGTSWKPLTITPQLLDFGRVALENGPTQGVMRIEFSEEAALASVQSQHPGFRATLKEVTPRRAYDLVVETTEALGTGRQQGAFLLLLEKPVPEGWPESVAVAARAHGDRAVSVTPATIIVPAGALPNARHQPVLVRCNDGTEGFAVTGAVLDGGPAFVQPEIREAGQGAYVVQLSLPAGWSAPPAPAVASLVITTTHPEYATLTVPIVTRGSR